MTRSSSIPSNPNRNRTALIALLGLLPVALAGCDTAKPGVPFNPIARHYARLEGRRVVERAVDAHGGMKAWENKQAVRFRLQDEWRGLAGYFIRPWPGERASGEFVGALNRGYGRIDVQSEEGAMTYGLGPEGPWARLGGRFSQEQEDLETARAVVPAYLFFFQLPFAFLSYDAVHHYMGVTADPPGGPVHEVLVTYPWYEGEVSQDWYVARFDTSTMRLRSVTYTMSRWGPTVFEYTDRVGQYEPVDSLWLPTRHVVRMTRPFRPGLHRWELSAIEFFEDPGDSLFRGHTRLAAGRSASGDTP